MRIVQPARIQAHRVYGGTDYGPRQLLLVDAPASRLMWVPGHTTYTGRMNGSGYMKSTLWLVRDDMSLTRRDVLSIAPGGRLSNALLQSDEVQTAATMMWGAEVARALCVDVTLVLGE